MSADELLRRLDELGAELKVRDRPERRAWNRLEPTRNGWTNRLYDDQAFQLWQDVLRRFPDDLRTVHHLAIMHHARAIDAEQSDHPRRSDVDWREALAHWHRLFEADPFWAELAERAEAAPDLVAKIRQDLAERLLRMHFDIALDERSPHHRARFHVALALGSPFPPEMVQNVRANAYERAIADVDATVWAPTTFEQELLWTAIGRVIHYLDRDQDCLPALIDLLRLLKQVQAGQVRHANGTVGPDEASQVLDGIRATARKYDSHLARLEPLLLAAADQHPLALSDLALWHSRVGHACLIGHAYDEATGYYERGLRAARAGEDPHVEELRVGWLLSTTLAAREHAVDDPGRARRLLGATEDFEDPPGVVLLARAQARLQLGDFDDAERDADAARSAIGSSAHDVNLPWNEDPDQLRAACVHLLEQISRVRLTERTAPHLEKAEQAMRSARWSEAITQLDAVLRMDENSVPALIRRAECRLGQFETGAAGTDLDRAERVIRVEDGDVRALDVVRELRTALTALHKQVTAYGGSKAAMLRHEGVKAFNDGRHDEAIKLLRSARVAALPKTPRKLDEELAACLNIAACELVKPVADDIVSGRTSRYPDLLFGELDRMRSQGVPFNDSLVDLLRLSGLGDRTSGALAKVRRAEAMLSEARSLHGTQVVVRNLDQVRLLRRRVEDMR